MRKYLLLIFLLFLNFNLYANKNIDEELKILNNIKNDLIIRYKTEIGLDFKDFDKNTSKEKRVFRETLYLHFISKYVEDIKDVIIFEKKKTMNVILFANEKIEKNIFDMIFDIIVLNEKDFKINLIQVPVAVNKVYSDVIQEKYSER